MTQATVSAVISKKRSQACSQGLWSRPSAAAITAKDSLDSEVPTGTVALPRSGHNLYKREYKAPIWKPGGSRLMRRMVLIQVSSNMVSSNRHAQEGSRKLWRKASLENHLECEHPDSHMCTDWR